MRRMEFARREEKENISLHLRREICGFQARHLQLASCLHFLGQKNCGLQAKYLKPASRLRFLRQELGGLRLRLLQSAFRLHFKIEITTETRSIARRCVWRTLF